MRSFYRYRDGAVPNTLAIAYSFGGFALGMAMLLTAKPWLTVPGTLVLAHAMIVSAYLLHDAAHGAVFRTAEANARLGAALAWINGSCYASFADLRRKHMRHHVDRADVLTFDAKAFLLGLPQWVRRVVLALEWAYFPAVELIMHGYVIAMPFMRAGKRSQRRRVATVLVVRAALFAWLAWLSLQAAALYLVAWLVCLIVLRFADAYQHTYDAFAVLEEGGAIPADKIRDHAYEQRNTYSNLVSVRYPALNLLLLNFSYHNAHHDRPVEPWYRLPAAHARLYGDDDSQVIPMARLLTSFHRHRVKRILASDYGVMDIAKKQADDFYGAVGVSFLTAV
ncbi:fatty acid desaturase [Paraburkholderia sp. RAU2J]|uniref:fatty acid desaturase family protein n=1 Tax=Paraburkholderia sp. RAU2J TaxID=1938810 RepID=UPI000F27AD0F|nr:fatty acid desaturase [Paraburkholderia sp. RAU2J]RKT22200.1 fatty acid desaturase [Paraburkholderia sp. RAU2J]